MQAFFALTDPVLVIEALGQSMKIHVIVISLGLPDRLIEAARTIRNSKAKNSRKWIVLQNCHLEQNWSQEFLRLLEVRIFGPGLSGVLLVCCI